MSVLVPSLTCSLIVFAVEQREEVNFAWLLDLTTKPLSPLRHEQLKPSERVFPNVSFAQVLFQLPADENSLKHKRKLKSLLATGRVEVQQPGKS